MDIVASLLVGVLIGGGIIYFVLQKTQGKTIIEEYESQIESLKAQHQQSLKEARNRSLDGSRAVIKGKIAEQLAPILPEFKYLPSDARFIGDPVDYVIFNGYTDMKDDNGDKHELEVVLLDVKTGHSSLSRHQQAILSAIEAGRIRFETIRPNVAERQHSNSFNPSHISELQRRSPVKPCGTSEIQHQNPLSPPFSVTVPPLKVNGFSDIRKTYPRAYEHWTNDEEEKLKARYKEGATINDLAKEFQRKPGGIHSRLKRLGLLP